MGRKRMSEEEESNEELVEEMPDYLDKAGRSWQFLRHAKKEEEEDLAQFVQQNGLVPGNENGKRRKFGCSRPECHFRAVFLKANSGIYTRGEHWHEIMDGQKASIEIPKSNERILSSLSKISKIICRDKEEIFIGSNGLEFKLVCSFETDEEFDEYRQENWLIKRGSHRSYKDRLYLCCRRYSRHSKLATNCRVFGVFVKHNRSLYQNTEQHNHPMGKEYNDHFSYFLLKYANEKKADYVDRRGQHWHFLRKIGNFDELENFAMKQVLYICNNKKRLFFFKCKYASSSILKRLPYPPPYCKMRAVFVEATSSIYVRNEHSHHPPFKLRSHKKNWSRHGRIHREWAKSKEGKNAEKNVENSKGNAEQQNVPMPKQEVNGTNDIDEEGEREVRIVKHLQRDYKCLGRMKREGQSSTSTDSWPVHGEEEEGMEMDREEEEQGISLRKKTGTFYRYTQRELRRPMKKEEPEEAEPEAELPVPQLQIPPNVLWLQQFAVTRPAKMLLRERKKRINYGK